MRYAAWFVVLWIIAWFFTPAGGVTATGAFIGHLIASFGVALIFFAPTAGTVAAVSMFRRKTHL